MNVGPITSPADLALAALIVCGMGVGFSLLHSLPHHFRNEAERLRYDANRTPTSLQFDEPAACNAIRQHYRSASGIGIEVLQMLMMLTVLVTFSVLKEQIVIRFWVFLIALGGIGTMSNWLGARLHRKSILKAVHSKSHA